MSEDISVDTMASVIAYSRDMGEYALDYALSENEVYRKASQEHPDDKVNVAHETFLADGLGICSECGGGKLYDKVNGSEYCPVC